MKHCVITGAADGIGKALAHQFAANGYRITGIDVDEKRAHQTQAELQQSGATASFIIANLASESDINNILEQLNSGPPIDVLIHNAGINAVGRFVDIPLAQQQVVIDVNFLAPMLLTAGLLKLDKIPEGGFLVFLSSLSHYVSYPGAATYAAGKDGLASYARSLSVSLAGQKIHVLTVFPGPTRTAHARRHSPDNSTEHRRMPPDVLAQKIYRAVQNRHRILIPGVGNKFFAFCGRYFPAIVETAMKKAIFDKLPG